MSETEQKRPTWKDWALFGLLLLTHAAVVAGLVIWAERKLE